MIFFIITLILLVVVAINSIWGPFLKNIEIIESNTSVSILIPAKNEKKRISKSLDTISNQDYNNFEILVLDDESDDGTYEFTKSNYPNIKVFKGESRPNGWLGKNWACHQLSKKANGEILIFTDADNWYSKSAISKTVSAITKYQLDMISSFPQNVAISFFEKIFSFMPEMILYSLLPLWLTLKSKKSSLAAANGQWIAIKSESYNKLGGHKNLKSTNVEDIEIARLAKKSGMKILTTSGIGTIYTRMYKSFNEINRGFSKNMNQMLGGNLFAILFNLFLFFSTFFVLFIQDLLLISVSLLAFFSWKLILSLRFKTNFIYSILFHPFILLFMLLATINSISNSKKQINWR